MDNEIEKNNAMPVIRDDTKDWRIRLTNCAYYDTLMSRAKR
jgi:hypothetical protein